MADGARGDPVVPEVYIEATPETVFDFFVNPEKLTRWLAVDATVDPVPGGVCHQIHAGGADRQGGPYDMRGEFIEVTPPARVVFTWGFTNPDVRVPPGSTTVEVVLTPRGRGTVVRLVHHDLPPSEIASHVEGWTEMLHRLARAVIGQR